MNMIELIKKALQSDQPHLSTLNVDHVLELYAIHGGSHLNIPIDTSMFFREIKGYIPKGTFQ